MAVSPGIASPNLILTSNRVAFETTDGVVGAAPKDVLPGNEVILFLGPRSPFILRRVQGRDQYRLVGDCYLEGVMGGEIS
jgi:hypothetical protein